jgi:hypothetical protein
MGPRRETGVAGNLSRRVEKTQWLEAEVFWAQLERYGVGLTEKYTRDRKQRFCKRRDGEHFLVSVHKRYPDYMVDKVLKENGFFNLPLYDSCAN